MVPPPARAALGSRLIAAADMTVEVLAARALARIGELAAAAETVAALPEVNETLAGAAVSYNYVSWGGGANAYKSCELDRWAFQGVGPRRALRVGAGLTGAPADSWCPATRPCGLPGLPALSRPTLPLQPHAPVPGHLRRHGALQQRPGGGRPGADAGAILLPRGLPE